MSLPIVSGVGNAASFSTSPVTGVIQGLGALSAVVNFFGGPKWGIFDTDGTPLLVSDSVRSVDVQREFQIATHPIEEGGFASYNKVAHPTTLRVCFLNGGQKLLDGPLGKLSSLIPGLGLANLGLSAVNSIMGNGGPGTLQGAKRASFLTTLDKLIEGLAIVRVVTPEATIRNANIIHYDYRREAIEGGASLIPIEVVVQEVRQPAPKPGTSTATPAGAAQESQGQVQPESLSDKALGAVNSGISRVTGAVKSVFA